MGSGFNAFRDIVMEILDDLSLNMAKPRHLLLVFDLLKKLLTIAEFELGSSEEKETMLTTWPPPMVYISYLVPLCHLSILFPFFVC